MKPQDLLQHGDSGQLWPVATGFDTALTVSDAYQRALALRQLRLARGEQPRGYKIGFTNRTIWPIYNVFAPIWGTVYDSTLSFCDGLGDVSLTHTCQPRIEPETVFSFARTPAPGASMDELFAALDWIAPGFEIVQSHLPDWKFTAAETVMDGALHAKLLVGKKLALGEVAASASDLEAYLQSASVTLSKNAVAVESGQGANVLDNPLRALHYFLAELRACPGATDIQPGDVVTTGTWTNAWPVATGETWDAEFTAPLGHLSVRFVK
jgi:2-oxo-3-hexenedioate decarboxylase